MPSSELFGLTALAIGSCMLGLWLLGTALRDASLVDIFWGPGFAIVAISSGAWTGHGSSPRGALLVAMAVIWGLRLGAYLAARNLGHGEDPRYAAMRRHWGRRFWWVSAFTVFALQGVLLWIVSLPIQLGLLDPGGALRPLDAVGALLWCTGLYFEAVGDWQLARFRRDPGNAGLVMDRGLWRYTRHPNYFGDFCVWWGIYVVALSTPWGPAGIAGPLVMSLFLMRVSGVPMLERTIAKRRPGYLEYARRTPAFFPRLPRPRSPGRSSDRP